MEKFIQSFLEDSKKKYSNNTLDTYVIYIRKFLNWFENNYKRKFDFKTIKPKHIEDYLKDETIRIIIHTNTSLKAFFNWAMDRGYINYNPVLKVKNRKKVNLPHWLSKKDLLKLDSLLKNNKEIPLQDRTIVSLILNTGLKIGEILNLKLKDIDLEKNILLVRTDNKVIRMIPLSASVKVLLEEFLIEKDKKKTNDYLFINQGGTQLSLRSVQRIIKKVAAISEIKDINASVLRHTFCRYLAISGADITAIAFLMDFKTKNGLPNIQSVLQYLPPSRNLEREKRKEIKRAIERLEIFKERGNGMFKITLENNDRVIYIYFRSGEENTEVKSIHGVKSYLLYDENENWAGIEITNKDGWGNTINLPLFDTNYLDESYKIKQSPESILIQFSSEKIESRREEFCSIDFNNDGLYGIEYILDTPIGGVEMIIDYLEYY